MSFKRSLMRSLRHPQFRSRPEEVYAAYDTCIRVRGQVFRLH